MKINSKSFLYIVVVLIYSCADSRDFLNPFDSGLSREKWKAENPAIEILDVNSVVLNWDYNIGHIDGFILTKKIGLTPIEIILDKNTRRFVDTLANPFLFECNKVSYSIEAYAGNNRSSIIRFDEVPEFPIYTVANAGPDIQTEMLSVQLNANSFQSFEKGTWQIVQGNGGVLVNAQNPKSVFTGRAFVPYLLKWQIESQCKTTSDEVSIFLKDIPTISDPIASNITMNSTEIKAQISSSYQHGYISKGIVWSKNDDPNLENVNSIIGYSEAAGNNIELNLTELQPQTTYYARAFVKHEHFVAYSNRISFKTYGIDFFFEMVEVKGGQFEMGCIQAYNFECYPEELPSFKATIDDFYIGKYEVTYEQWRMVLGLNHWYYAPFKECDKCPIENIRYTDVQLFISTLNTMTGKKFRLPTEAEWEYAARGGRMSKGYLYSGSNNLDDVAWHFYNSSAKSHPVGSKLPNELGIFDMTGNVMEMCSDLYGPFSEEAKVNPQGATSHEFGGRVFKGSSWSSQNSDNYLWRRKWYTVNYWNFTGTNYSGFRLALSKD